MAVLILLLTLSTCIFYTAEAGNTTFILGIPYNHEHKHTSSKVVITTASRQNISYSVSVNDILLGEGFVSYSQPAHVTIPEEYIVNNATFTNRYKGIIVEASGKVSVIAINSYYDHGASTGVVHVLPLTEYLAMDEYTYYAMSSKSKKSSLLLLVGGINNTTIHIKPSVNVSVPNDPQRTSTANIDITKGNTHTITLHQAQTLLLEADGEDLSGTEIVSNKPLSVISGHECLNIPSDKGGCDQVLAQIPPTVTWGKDFLLVPFAGRKGQIYKIVSSAPNTVIEHNCENDIIKRVSLIQGQTIEVKGHDEACHLKSNEPILVAQFALGQDVDGLGDPALMIVPPLEQYVDQVTFESLPIDFSFPKQYITIISLSKHFNPTLMQLDGNLIHCEWSLIYNANFSEILGYYCHLEMTSKPGTHLLNYRGSNGRFAAMMYGFNGDRYKRQGYAYNGGQSMTPINAVVQVKFVSSHYEIFESDKFVVVELERLRDSDSLAVSITAINDTAVSGSDYQQLDKQVVFDVGETRKHVKIPIIDDQMFEWTERFFIKVQPLCNYSISDEATITIKDNDIINIGFFSSTPVNRSNTREVRLGKISGDMQSDIEVKVELRLEFITTDTQDIVTSFTKHIDITRNHSDIMLPLQCCNDMDSITIVGILTLSSNFTTNASGHVTLYPSVLLIEPLTTPTPTVAATMTTEVVLPIPSIGFIKQGDSISLHSPLASSRSWSDIILAALIGSLCTAIVVSIISIFGCYCTYKYGRNGFYSYRYVNTKRIDDTETYFVQSVNNSINEANIV